MKKFFALFLSLMMLFACTAMAETIDMSAPTFVVGEDEAEYYVDGASGWNVVTAFVKITAGEDVLFNGTVTVTSDNLTVAEFTLAAVYELGCGQEGLENGFVTSIGEYVSGTDANGNSVYWANTVNGKYVPHTCTDMKVLEGYYIEWDFIVYDADAGFETSAVRPCGYAAPFEVGEDEAEYEVDGASGWNVANINVKITAGEDVLFNGVVTLTSDNLTIAEATLAAIYELGCGQEGLENGFVTSIGEYVSGTDANGNSVYWANTVNGKYVPFSCDQLRLLDGDYVQWDFVTYVAE
nr:DUF4430 domain-containing protein [Clostridia bacterium]